MGFGKLPLDVYRIYISAFMDNLFPQANRNMFKFLAIMNVMTVVRHISGFMSLKTLISTLYKQNSTQ